MSVFVTETGGATKRRARGLRPGVEALEGRAVMSTGVSASALGAATHLHARAAAPPLPPFGTIQGRVTNDANGHGINGVKVQLIDGQGHVVRTTVTHAGGRYRFFVPEAPSPYVIHVVTPRRFVQTSPTFAFTEPEGSFGINPVTGQPYNGTSWNYTTGNSNPSNGPVGPPFWATIAPAGHEPIESPINITAPAIDLSQYLTINYANAVPSQAINNGKQIQVQFPAGDADTINLGGTTFELKQFHFHDPSENLVNGRASSLELHFVNESASGAETVVAVFLNLGAHNDALDPILAAATADLNAPRTSTTIAQPINFQGLLPQSRAGWFYTGTLTTPPLSGPVNFLVLASPITLDYAQLQAYEQIAAASGFLPNARAAQPLDGRRVNEFNIDLAFKGGQVGGLNFTLSPAVAHVRAVHRRLEPRWPECPPGSPAEAVTDLCRSDGWLVDERQRAPSARDSAPVERLSPARWGLAPLDRQPPGGSPLACRGRL
ncbi:MAG: carbonic anhydrase family protein [Isosphaeraceae bacterium]